MAIEIREDNLNSGSVQSGLGVPTHLASIGTLFTDKGTGTIYINKNGSNLWSNISTSGSTGGGSITAFTYSQTNNTFSIVESGVTYSAAINIMSGLSITNTFVSSGNTKLANSASNKVLLGKTPTVGSYSGGNIVDGLTINSDSGGISFLRPTDYAQMVALTCIDSSTMRVGGGNQNIVDIWGHTTAIARFTNTGGGRLGILTTSPQFTLDVSGNTRITGELTANTFSAVSNTMSGIKGNIITNGSSTTAFITVSGSNTIGGVDYVDFIRVTNTFVGATNINKTIRVNSAGAIEFINSAYNAQTFNIADNGFVYITGPASVNTNSATNNALNIGTTGQLFDDGNFHIHAKSGNLWLNALEGGDIRLGTQTNKLNSSVIVDTTIVGHSFFTKVQSGFNVAFGTEISMDNLKVRINSTGGSGGLIQAGAVSGSFNAYTTLFGNVAGSAVQGDTNSAGITFTTTYQNISGAQLTLAAGGDVTTLHLTDTTNSRIYRITAIHCQGTTGGYTSIERMA
jgi:hypothetical protein